MAVALDAEKFQETIPDRDARASYYTKPATAEFLANMTVARLQSPGRARYVELCAGTGILARAVEANIRQRHYAHSSNMTSIHADRLENCIQLTDVNPQAISIAIENMASLEPETPFDARNIFALTQEGGALNFLYTGSAMRADICCNNDPYFRARGGASNPISSVLMGQYKRLADKMVKGVAHGQAGLATFMHVIEHSLLEDGSPHGKVLPLTAAHADTYTGFRKNIANEYCDVIAISNAGGDGISMSSDTVLQEMLLIGTKHSPPHLFAQEQYGDRAVTCINLTKTFHDIETALQYAEAIRSEVALGKKAGEIVVGDVVGTYYRMDDVGDGRPWSCLGVNGELTALIDALTHGVGLNLPTTTLGAVSNKDATHHLIGCTLNSKAPRGAFIMHPVDSAEGRSDFSLWEVSAKKQTAITCAPTHYGVPRGDSMEAVRMRATSGHFHLSRDLRMSAQAVVMAYTEAECMGGSAWTTIKADEGVMEAIALFLNSTYGMLIRVGYGQSTTLGRSRIQVRAIDNHPIPDFALADDAAQNARGIAVQHFDRLRTLPLKRISLSVLDKNRAELDRIVSLMLGIPWNNETQDMLAYWRELMCSQPVVHGNNREVLLELAQHDIDVSND